MIKKWVLLVVSLGFSSVSLADHVLPLLVPLYNLSKVHPGKNCASTSCSDHVVAIPSEIPRMLNLGYSIYGLGGEFNGGHIGCVIQNNSGDYKYIQRRFDPKGVTHIVATAWEIETNSKSIASRFSSFRSNIGYLESTKTSDMMVPLFRAYNAELNDYIVFGADSSGYEGERQRIESAGYNSFTKELGYMYHRSLCQSAL